MMTFQANHTYREVTKICEMAGRQAAILVAMGKVGIRELKPEQKRVINCCWKGPDVFAALPTGYGKSYCFAMLPHIYDYLREKKEPTSIIIIVSLLQSLMLDQKRFGISAQVVKSEEFNDPDNNLRKEIMRESSSYFI